MVLAYYKEAVSRAQYRREKRNRAWWLCWLEKKEIGAGVDQDSWNVPSSGGEYSHVLQRGPLESSAEFYYEYEWQDTTLKLGKNHQ